MDALLIRFRDRLEALSYSIVPFQKSVVGFFSFSSLIQVLR
jgi:hypothetical protein